jgi:histidyl-tRNA synthetase
LEKLPSYRDFLTKSDLIYLEELNELLNKLEINHHYNENLVRGLDYYTGIVFELLLVEDSEKSVILGGGRYDNLFQRLGEVNFPAAGFALGIDRLVNYLVSLDN